MQKRFAPLVLAAFASGLTVSASAQWQPHGVGVCTANFAQVTPVACSDGAGGVIIAWSDARFGDGLDIYAQWLDQDGVPQWTVDGVLVCAAPEAQTSPVIVTDEAGGAIIAWDDRRFGNANVDVYAQRVSAAGSTLWTPNGLAICSAVNIQHNLVIARHGAGATIVWHDYRFNFNAADLYAQRVDDLGAAIWSVDGVAVTDAANHQGSPRIVGDGAGGAVVAWLDFRSGSQYDVYVQRLDNNGVGLWTFNGVALCTAANSKFNPEMVTDGAGGAIVVWQDYRDVGNPGIYAGRVDNAGFAVWSPVGVALCTAVGVQDVPAIASDGAGGAIAAWDDSRSGISIDMYAQQVSSSGVTGWATDGVAICTAAASQTNPVVTPDGAGGAIVAWEDYRNSNADIYARRVDASGTTQWAVDGVVVSVTAGDQWRPTMITDGAGGAIAAWMDERYGIYQDIFSQRIPADGSVPTAIERTPTVSHLKLSPNFPNPFSEETSMDLDLPADANVSVEVYDVAGREVRSIEAIPVSAGTRHMTFDGRDDEGRLLPSGVYFYRVTANNSTSTRKMVIER